MPKSLSLLPFLFVCSLLTCSIEVDISVPSFPDLAAYFGISENYVQWTIAFNFLGFALASFFYGPLSESYGRRPMMIWGNILLVIGAFECVIAPSLEWLFLARFIQGLGAATSAVVVFAMIADAYKTEQAVRLIGLMNALLTAFMTFAPILGGFLNHYFGWQGNYLTVAVISFLSWVLLFFLLPETKEKKETFFLKKIINDYKILLSNGDFVVAALVPSIFYATYLSFIGNSSFLYMDFFGLSMIAYTFLQSFIVACFFVVSLFVGKMTVLLGQRNVLILGLGLSVLGAAGFFLLSITLPLSPFLVTLSMSIFAMGFALCYPIIFTFSLEIFPEMKGSASSLIMVMRSLLCAFWVGLSGYCYNGKPFPIALIILTSTLCILLMTNRLIHKYFFLRNTGNNCLFQ